MNKPTNQNFSVGIDLGTTHCVLSYADFANLDNEDFSQQVMPIPQLTAPGTVEDNLQLPSFIYQAHKQELAKGTAALPWTNKPKHLVGEIARNMGSKTPIRLVSSAKSWLCHAGIDCKAPILPADATGRGRTHFAFPSNHCLSWTISKARGCTCTPKHRWNNKTWSLPSLPRLIPLRVNLR